MEMVARFEQKHIDSGLGLKQTVTETTELTGAIDCGCIHELGTTHSVPGGVLVVWHEKKAGRV